MARRGVEPAPYSSPNRQWVLLEILSGPLSVAGLLPHEFHNVAALDRDPWPSRCSPFERLPHVVARTVRQSRCATARLSPSSHTENKPIHPSRAPRPTPKQRCHRALGRRGLSMRLPVWPWVFCRSQWLRPVVIGPALAVRLSQPPGRQWLPTSAARSSQRASR